MKTIAVIGAGGNAREVAGIIRDVGGFEFVGFLADRQGQYDSPLLGTFEWLKTHKIDCLAMGIGSPGARSIVGDMLLARHPEIEWPALVHPTAYVSRSCHLGKGTIICVGAIATENVVIGSMSQLNFGCSVGHEANIESGTLINPRATVSGGVRIGRRVMVGAGATILQYLKIGDDAIVGAGAVVTTNVPSGTTVVGVPARPLPQSSPTSSQ